MKAEDPCARFEVSVQPRASREGVGRAPDGSLRVRVTAAPVEGEANEAVLKVLAKALGLRRSQLSIERGHTSRRKLVRVSGLTPAELERRLPPAE